MSALTLINARLGAEAQALQTLYVEDGRFVSAPGAGAEILSLIHI